MEKLITLRNKTIICYQDIRSLDFPTLVFIHGNGGSKDVWEGIIQSDHLKNFRIITLDLPGHGTSSKLKKGEYTFLKYGEIVAEIIELLNLKNTFLIGHSLGADVILQSVEKYRNVSGMILISNSPVESLSQLKDAYLFPKESSVLFSGNISPDEGDSFAKICVHSKTVDSTNNISKWMLQTDGNARLDISADIPNLKNEWKIIEELPFPVAYVAGEYDQIVNIKFIEDQFPKTNLWHEKVTIMKNAGHYLPVEFPELLAQLISNYVKERI